MTASSLGSGRSTAAVVDAQLLPRVPHALPPVIFLHGANGDGSQAVGVGVPSANPILCKIGDAGYTIVAPSLGGLSWANGTQSDNTTAMGRVKDAITRCRALGAISAKAVLFGESMGSLTALRYAAIYPTEIACVIGVLTICGQTSEYNLNTHGNRVSIGTAFGVTYPTALPAQSDPSTMTANFSGIPLLLHHSSDDTWWTDSSLGDTFVAATGATVVNVGALGHTDASIAATDRAAVVAFIQAHS